MARPTIQVGSKGQDVKDAQQALIDRGYPVGTAGVDGIFGLHTYRAVLDYQDDRSKSGGPGPEVPARWGFNYLLAVDGVIGPSTWGRLVPDPIQQGSTGPLVMLAQNILHWAAVFGGFGPTVDPGLPSGTFDAATKTAVQNFQNLLGITPADGTIKETTWTAILS
jgi:peptidoglycan hydrolase-like protein with peptidoglycan-binding domain